jgi:hypothetical protein
VGQTAVTINSLAKDTLYHLTRIKTEFQNVLGMYFAAVIIVLVEELSQCFQQY